MKFVIAILALAIIACAYAQKQQFPQPQGGLYDQDTAAAGEGKTVHKRGIIGHPFGYGGFYGAYGFPYYGYGYGFPYYGYGGFYG